MGATVQQQWSRLKSGSAWAPQIAEKWFVLSGGCRSSGEANLVASGPLLTTLLLVFHPSTSSHSPSLNSMKVFRGKADAVQLGPPDPGPPQPFDRVRSLLSGLAAHQPSTSTVLYSVVQAPDVARRHLGEPAVKAPNLLGIDHFRFTKIM